jgi:hypothetical protein
VAGDGGARRRWGRRQTRRIQGWIGEREVAADRICVAAGRIEPGGGESRRGVGIDVGVRDLPSKPGSAAEEK